MEYLRQELNELEERLDSVAAKERNLHMGEENGGELLD